MMRGVWARERERSIQGIDCEWGKEIQKQTSSAQCSRAFKEKLIFHCRRARIGIGIGIGTDAKWQQEVPTRGWYRTNARKGKGKAGKGKRCCFVRLVAWCFHGWLLNRVVPAQAAPSNKIRSRGRSRSRSRGHTGCSPFWPLFHPLPYCPCCCWCWVSKVNANAAISIWPRYATSTASSTCSASPAESMTKSIANFIVWFAFFLFPSSLFPSLALSCPLFEF